MMPVANCKTCGAPIIWAVTKNQKRIPIDAEPNEDGNVELHTRGSGTPFAHVRSAAAPTLFADDSTNTDEVLYMPHHATCPNWGTS